MGSRIWDLGFRVSELGFRIFISEFRVDLGFSVKVGLGFRV